MRCISTSSAVLRSIGALLCMGAYVDQPYDPTNGSLGMYVENGIYSKSACVTSTGGMPNPSALAAGPSALVLAS